MSKSYRAADIEVLSGLEPVRRRPGMYTDTTRPNHLVHEVIDNSVDEALAGHAKSISVKLFADGSVEVADDGREAERREPRLPHGGQPARVLGASRLGVDSRVRDRGRRDRAQR